MEKEPIIIKAKITPLPRNLFDEMPKVIVFFDDGSSRELFEFYPDEISFSPEEFIGLTEEQAHRLRFEKDKKYLQS